jgi:hypothetical protein
VRAALDARDDMAERALHETRAASVAFDFALRAATSPPTPAHAATAVAAAARATPKPSSTTAAATNSLLRQCAHVSTSCSCLLRVPGHHRPQNVGNNTSMDDALNVFDEMGTRYICIPHLFFFFSIFVAEFAFPISISCALHNQV